MMAGETGNEIHMTQENSKTIQKMIALAATSSTTNVDFAANSLSVSIGKTARQLFDVKAEFENPIQEDKPKSGVLKSTPDPGLLVVVSTPGNRFGLLCLDGMLINAVVEIMTGASDTAVFRDPRAPTLIDAALCREFCETLLEILPGELAEAAGRAVLPNLGYVRHETDAGKLAFTLADQGYTCITGAVAFQAGLRGGEMTLALPDDLWSGAPLASSTCADPGWAAALEANVLAAPLKLRAELETVTLMLGDALALGPGDVVRVSTASLSNLDLVTDRGVGLLTGRLGQVNGKKAISVNPVSSSEIYASEMMVDGSEPDGADVDAPAALPPDEPLVMDERLGEMPHAFAPDLSQGFDAQIE